MDHYIPSWEKPLHTQVVQASASTYYNLINRGLQVTANPISQTKTSVGAIEKIYPDIVVWKANPSNPQQGTVVLVENIETTGSVNYNIDMWRRLGEINQVEFTLVVPFGTEKNVLTIIRENVVRVNRLQSYQYVNGKYVFYNVPIK